MEMHPAPVLSIQNLKVHFGSVRAVDGVDMDIVKGEVMGLVGESGSGKTTIGRAMIGLDGRHRGVDRVRRSGHSRAWAATNAAPFGGACR